MLCIQHSNTERMEIDRASGNHHDHTLAPKAAAARHDTTRPSKIQVVSYEPNVIEISLCDTLNQWRLEKFEREFPDEVILGPALIMPTSLVARIVDLAHNNINNISCTQQLIDQTGWTASIA